MPSIPSNYRDFIVCTLIAYGLIFLPEIGDTIKYLLPLTAIKVADMITGLIMGVIFSGIAFFIESVLYRIFGRKFSPLVRLLIRYVSCFFITQQIFGYLKALDF